MKNIKEAYELLKGSSDWGELKKYLKDFDGNNPLKVNDIWNIINQVWDNMGLDNKNYNLKQLSKYYSHPFGF